MTFLWTLTPVWPEQSNLNILTQNSLMIASVCFLQSRSTEWKDQRMDVFDLVLKDYCICRVFSLQGLQAWEIGLNPERKIGNKFHVKYAACNSKTWQKFHRMYLYTLLYADWKCIYINVKQFITINTCYPEEVLNSLNYMLNDKTASLIHYVWFFYFAPKTCHQFSCASFSHSGCRSFARKH